MNYDNWYTIGWPWLGIPVNVCLILKKFPVTKWWVLYIPFAMSWSLFWWKFVPERHVPPKRSFIIISIMSMICGFIWTNFVIVILVDVITAVGIITKLSATYLALTIIAVGNALPDAIITVALAKKGKATLGITGSYAGQLFGLLVGFGVGMLKKSLTSGERIKFDLFLEYQDNMLNIFVVFTLFISLVVTFFYATNNNLKYDNKFGFILAIIYFSFLLVSTIIEVYAEFFS